VSRRWSLLCALLLALAGCGSRIDQAAFAKIQTDMPEAEVMAILGEPTDTEGFSLGGLSATSATWEGPEGTIAIQFVNAKVLLKTFTSEPPAAPQ
jgi:hypothetical protein